MTKQEFLDGNVFELGYPYAGPLFRYVYTANGAENGYITCKAWPSDRFVYYASIACINEDSVRVFTTVLGVTVFAVVPFSNLTVQPAKDLASGF